jgi:hypothetical protein
VAIGSARGVAATTTLVRITMGSPALSVIEAAFVSAAPLSPSPHAPRRSTPPTTNTTALRMTRPSSSDVGEPSRQAGLRFFAIWHGRVTRVTFRERTYWPTSVPSSNAKDAVVADPDQPVISAIPASAQRVIPPVPFVAVGCAVRWLAERRPDPHNCQREHDKDRDDNFPPHAATIATAEGPIVTAVWQFGLSAA